MRPTPQAATVKPAVPAAPSYHLLPNTETATDRFMKMMKLGVPIAILFILAGIILIVLKHKALGTIFVITPALLSGLAVWTWDKQRKKEERLEVLKESVSIDRAFMLAERAKSQSVR